MAAVTVLGLNGWAAVIAVVAFVFYPFETRQMDRLNWYNYGLRFNTYGAVKNDVKFEGYENIKTVDDPVNPVVKKRIWIAWFASYFFIGITMLAIVLNPSSFGSFSNTHSVDVVLALIVVTTLVIKMWTTASYAFDRPTLAKNQLVGSEAQFYYYRNTALRYGLTGYAILLTGCAIATLGVLGAIYENNTPSKVAITFWTLTTVVTLIGLYYTIHAMNLRPFKWDPSEGGTIKSIKTQGLY